MKWEKIFSNHIPHKVSLCKIYKKLKQLNRKKINTSIKMVTPVMLATWEAEIKKVTV
jgi:hypothetical protein